jgi:hypothetical protein
MGIRCEGIALLYTPLESPLELPGGHRVSTISPRSIGGRLTFDLAGWNSCYVMNASTMGLQFHPSAGPYYCATPREHGRTPGTLSHSRTMWKILLNVSFPVERGIGLWIPDNESQSIGLDGAIDSKWYAFPSRKHMTERPIYELSMRHRPDNQPSFHRWRNGSRCLGAFPAPGLHGRASFRG